MPWREGNAARKSLAPAPTASRDPDSQSTPVPTTITNRRRTPGTPLDRAQPRNHRSLPMHPALYLVPTIAVLAAWSLAPIPRAADDRLPKAFVDGAGWTELTLADFENVNGTDDTWTQRDGTIVGTGKPLGGARSKQRYRNFELVLEWKHATHAGNSGVFVWCPESAFTDLPAGTLPRSGIEVQVLDLGYEENWQKSKGVPSDWFTSHGDVFPVGGSTMTAFTPQIEYATPDGEAYTVGKPDSSRSFPTRRLTRAAGEWNHYYIRAINGEIRLWVNGVEVNGGTACAPAEGYLALEAEGAPIEYRNLRIRELP